MIRTMGERYRYNVSLYDESPHGTLDLVDCVEICGERLKLYKILELHNNLTLEELKAHLKGSPLNLLLEKSYIGQEARRIDYISHWFLRIAYAKKSIYHYFFLKYETLWFKFRYDCMEKSEQDKFLEEHDLLLEPVSRKVKANLEDCMEIYKEMDACYCVRFTEALSSLTSSEYLVDNGYLYIPHKELGICLQQKLEKKLKEELISISKRLPTAEDDQLETILSSLNLVTPWQIKYGNLQTIDLSELDRKATENFPLCMRYQHNVLRNTHHLKYFSRMQYGLFLKGIGLTLEQTLELFKDEFINDMPEKKFWQKYSYLFKHQYGTVGSKIDYLPYSCEKIFEEPSMPGQCNGCPYKHRNSEFVRNMLSEYGFPADVIEEIIKLQKAEKYNEACTKYFEHCHSHKLEEPIIHPNVYYEASCKCTDGLIDIEDIFENDLF